MEQKNSFQTSSRSSLPGGRIPPHHLEAERSVLGAILLNNETVHRILEVGLEARDFYKEAHQKIFEAALHLTERGEPVDLITMTTLLRDRGSYEQVGGSATLTSLFDDTFAVGNVIHYARIVRDQAILRRMIQVTAEIASEAYDGIENTEAFLDDAERKVLSISDAKLTKSFSSMQEILVQNMHSIEELSQKRADVIGLSTGFHDFDRLTSGLRPGQLIIIAARPAMGKTSLFLSAAQNIATSSKGVVCIFSLEMSKEELGFRFLSGMTRIDSKKLKVGRLVDSDWPRLAQAADLLSKSKIFIDDSGDLTVMDIRARCRRLLTVEKRLDLIVVDYLQLMKGSKSAQKGDGSREREISEISRNLKSLAKEMKVPIIALSQLNRGVESRPNKRPMLSDLRECVVGDTLVVLADGRRVPIQGLVGQTPLVLSMDEGGRIIPAEADLVWSVGQKEVFEVLLASGRKIKATGKHRLYSAEGWKKINDLRIGDRLAIARELPQPKTVETWPDERVVLLAHLIGEGSYLKQRPVRYTTTSEVRSKRVSDAAIRQFGMTVSRSEGSDGEHQLAFMASTRGSKLGGMTHWLRELGIYGQSSSVKRIPQSVFRLSNTQIALFLSHLWAVDGTIAARKTKQKDHYCVHFTSCSLGLAEDVVALLLRLGVEAKIQAVHFKCKTPTYMVWVRGVGAQNAFLSQVDAFVPNLRLTRSATATLSGDLNSSLGHTPSNSQVSQGSDLLGPDLLSGAAKNDLSWDRIISIHSLGHEEVFDLTVPKTASWLADGIVSHNSGAIEQDADMVCFIYRDEVYNKESEDKGIAELIVAKHRAGETDTIRLAWLAEYTLFANLDRNYPGAPIVPIRPDKGDDGPL